MQCTLHTCPCKHPRSQTPLFVSWNMAGHMGLIEPVEYDLGLEEAGFRALGCGTLARRGNPLPASTLDGHVGRSQHGNRGPMQQVSNHGSGRQGVPRQPRPTGRPVSVRRPPVVTAATARSPGGRAAVEAQSASQLLCWWPGRASRHSPLSLCRATWPSTQRSSKCKVLPRGFNPRPVP